MPRSLPPLRQATPWTRRSRRGACEVFWTRTLSPVFRKCHSRQHPLAVARIASGEEAQGASVIQFRSGNCCVELILAGSLHYRCQWQSGEQRPSAGIGVDLEFTGRAGLGPYDSPLGFVTEAPCEALDGQVDMLDAFQWRAAPLPTHVTNCSFVNRHRAVCRLTTVQAQRLLIRAGVELAAVAREQSPGV